jgi:hypothetical protein
MQDYTRALWGGPLVLAMFVGCIGDIGDGGEGDDVGSQAAPLCGSDVPFARRLTVSEYGNAVQAALGVDIHTEATASIPADLRADGFSNTAGSLIVTLDHVQGYDALAQSVVAQLDMSSVVTMYTSCTDFTEPCERELITRMGMVLYRSTVQAPESDALMPLFGVVQAEGESFDVAAGLVLEAMLQSPRFIYRLETEVADESTRDLDGFEMASRLSFLLWGAPPDDALFNAADGDALRTDEQIAAQIDRMLADPRARETSRRYLRDWLNLDRLDNLTRDATLFPNWDPQLALDMKAETLSFFEHLVWDENRALADLFNAQLSFVTPALAAHYGVDADADGKADLSSVSERGGLLTQGALLTVGGNTASMVARGQYVLENVLCGKIGSPPPGIDTTPPETEPGKSQRSYSEERVNNPSCGGCHSQMEPLVWGLERYDATGAYKLTDNFDNDLVEDGAITFPVSGEVANYESASELMNLLANSPEMLSCFGEKSTQFAIGRPLSPGSVADDKCTLDAVNKHLEASAGTYRDIIIAIALSPTFRKIQTQDPSP